MTKKERAIKILKVLKKAKGISMLGKMGSNYNAWKILISTILSARARDEVTEPLSAELFKKYGTAKSLASANPRSVEKLIKRIGFYKNKTRMIINASKQVLEDYHGRVPHTMDELLKLSGVGRKVAGCVMVYAYNEAAIPVDTHVHRLSNRLGFVTTKQPLQTEKELIKLVPKKYWPVVNEVFVIHGKTLCKPIVPVCSACPVYKLCPRIGVTKRK